ncbi:MAG: hypothetical protein NXI23_08840 [Bacteroidetes bacterium]|jgi:hypothetical protein|nr:hypothetical protein [Bacteroidota bacterium]MDF1865834.1 hypothetical protein [Saprospiraceae bacterium]
MCFRFKHRLRGSFILSVHQIVLFFFIVFFPVFLFASNDIIYVKSNANGDGSSWSQAMGNLHQAIRKATYGTEIWIANGIYYTTETNDRNASFQIPKGIKLYGGFSGQETSCIERKPLLYQTILSGAIGSLSNNDNAYSVIYTYEANGDTVIDGFYIEGGNANEYKAQQGSRSRSGGGWYNEVGKSISSPIVRNCIFRDNKAIDGGAIYNNALKSDNSIIIINSQFIGNVAMSDGGAIYNDCRLEGQSNLVVRGTIFQLNESNNGGCIFNYSFNGNGYGQLTNCQFASNRAMSRGSIIYDGSFKSRSFDVNNCNFLDNVSHEGNPFYQIGKGDARIQEVKVKRI